MGAGFGFAVPVIDGGVTAGVLPVAPVAVEPAPDEEVLPVLVLPVPAAPVGVVAGDPADEVLPVLTDVLGIELVLVEPLVVAPCENGLCAAPFRWEVPGVDWTLITGSDDAEGGGVAGSGACATGVELEELDSRTGTATIAASSTAATGHSFFC